MATLNTINDLIAARDIANIRGDIGAVNLLNSTISTLTSDVGGLDENLSPVVNPTNNRSTTVLDTQPQTPVRPPSTARDAVLNDSIPLSPNTFVECDYRYSFGCPVFSKYIADAGCRILIPVYRTCYTSTTNGSVMPGSELIGNIEITAYGEIINESFSNYVNEFGVRGTRIISGTKITSQGLFNAILGFGGLKTTTNWIQNQDGVYRNTNTLIQLDTVVSNLLDLTTSAIGVQPKGTLQQWAEYLSSTCDLSITPQYCMVSESFVPNRPVENDNSGGGSGKYCNVNVGKIQIPNTRQLLRTESRPIDAESNSDYVRVPNKPCTIGIEKKIQTLNIYTEQYGFPCYSSSDFTGNIIGYDSVENRETTEFGAITTTYVAERQDPNCSYTEYEREYEEDDPANPCLGVIKKDVIRKYEDGRQEVYAKGVFVRYFRRMDADCSPETIKVYHPLDLGSDVITGKVKSRTTGLFNYSQSLSTFATSSTQSTSSKKYYYEVTDTSNCERTPYFAVAYGHVNGSGSLYVDGEIYDTATKTVYSQYRLLALDATENRFEFYTNGVATQSKDVYVINFYRNGLSDRLDPGNFQLSLARLNGESFANNVYTGSNVQVSSSNVVFHFIDSSGDTSENSSCVNDPYVSYDIVSGSLTAGVYPVSSRHTYGTVYPNLGIIVLDPSKLNSDLVFNTVTGSNISGDNAMKLFKSISGSAVLGSPLKARNVKYKTTNHYFIRVGAPYANYSNNPTYVTGSDGYLFHSCFDTNPQTYITTIGLYNDFNELLAVAKLSQPINKSFDNDVLVKIRLNW